MVFIDGVDVRHIPLHVLRGAIGFVNQEPFLFSTTLAENVAFGARGEQGDRDHVAAAASIARLDKDLAQFPQGYDTTVGERGITLSGGQKQRVAIARALVIDPEDPRPGRCACRRWTPTPRRKSSTACLR